MSPHPIFTLTGNLLWERTLEFADWAAGQAQRAGRESFQVGGKGVNVAKMCNRIGATNTALVFAGGSTGEECVAWMRERGFACRAFPAERPTRIGIVVRSAGRPDTTFFGPDALPGAAAVRGCAEFLDGQPAGGVLAICGSVPGWDGSEYDPLRAAIERWCDRGAVCVDTYGPALAWFAGKEVALVKINGTEFEGLVAGVGEPCSRPQRGRLQGPNASRGLDVPLLLAEVRRRFPVKVWIVTDGPGPVWLGDERGTVRKFTPPKIREVSATGSGDVFLACMLHGRYHLGKEWGEAVEYSLPYAAANAAHSGIAEFPDPGQ